MKKLLAIMMVLAMLMVSMTAVASAEGKPLKIGYYGLSPTQAFFKQIWESIDAHCKERGYELVSFYTDADPAKMRSAYDQMVTQQVDCIIDGNAYADIILPFAEQSVANGINYIACFVTYDNPEIYTFGPSNVDMGIASGTYLGNIVKDEWGGQVDLILECGTFSAGADITVRLTSGADTLGTIVDTSKAEILQLDVPSGNMSAAYQLVMDALTAHPNMKTVIFCQTDDIASSAFAAVEAAGQGENVVGVGNDCVDAAQEYWATAIKEGNMKVPWRGSVYLDTYAYGGLLVDMAENIVAGKQEEHAVVAPAVIGGLGNWEELWPDLLERDFSSAS